MRRIKIIAAFLCACTLTPSAHAELLMHSFSIVGDNGESGSGSFVWDNAVVADGSAVSDSLTSLGDIVSLSIEITGGNIIGGTSVFTQGDCVGAFLENAPDFQTDINFFCNNGVNTLSGFSNNVNYLNDTVDFGAGLRQPALGVSSSTLTISPGITRRAFADANTVPSTPVWSLLLAMALILLSVSRERYLRMAQRAST
jgi:hypothetical protein